MVDEPLVYQRNYQVEWVAPRVNLRKLALLRFIQGKTERELVQYFGRSKTAIHELLARMLKNDFRHANLNEAEKRHIFKSPGHKYSQLAILVIMKVAFYEKVSGKNPIEDFILTLPKTDQARFADVFDGIEKHGLSCPRVQFRQLRGKLWEIKFNAASGGYRIA